MLTESYYNHFKLGFSDIEPYAEAINLLPIAIDGERLDDCHTGHMSSAHRVQLSTLEKRLKSKHSLSPFSTLGRDDC